MIKKIVGTKEAVASLPDQASLMIGGFMGVGTPTRLLDEIVRQGISGLTVIANDTARPGVGIGRLIDARLVKKVIVSHIGTNVETQRQMIDGELEVELVPQGTLAERIRAGGYGLGGILTPTGIGTIVAEGKAIVKVDGRDFLLEEPLRADAALIAAKYADYYGNLNYMLTARNFNPIMAMAADLVIAEPQTIVPVGVIPPDSVMTPSILVDHMVGKESSHG
jgi:acetate CoA/acetoacetate CoA-transferase alpha subunit